MMKTTSLAFSALLVGLAVTTLAAPTRKAPARKEAVEAMDGWTSWSPRTEIAPSFSVEGKTLKITGNGNPGAFGVWRKTVTGIEGGRAYRFTARQRARSVPFEQQNVSARLVWLTEKGEQARPPDYMMEGAKSGEWTILDHSEQAPEGAKSVMLELGLRWAPKGEVCWDEVKLEPAGTMRNRVVRAVTVFHRPRGTKSAAESVAEFVRQVDSASADRPDIVCLPEGITVVGNGKSYAEVCEAVPGPTTKTLGDVAKRLHCYIVAGLYERVGPVIYNTAVLIDRNGELAGRYRKTHLPREEVEGGLTPGDSYPVFDTDFGKVGIMICWDLQFPEPARALALKGAEVILLPIWGGSEVLARARAIENHVFLVSSSYDMKTFIVDPAGTVLSEAAEGKPIASAELYLDRKIVQPWLGDMKPRTWKERRPDIPVK